MNVTFLLGAGISRSVLPLSGDLNALITSGHASDGRFLSRTPDGLYGIYAPGILAPEFPGWGRRVRAFLGWLAGALGDEWRDYESLYFACQQVDDDLSCEYENPLLRPFVAECLAHLAEWWGSEDVSEHVSRDPAPKLHDLVREARNYISGAVAAALEHSPMAREQLDRIHAPLLDACRDIHVRFVDVVTLNHDTLFEESFMRAAIPIEDGFKSSRRFDGIAVWNGYMMRGGPRVRLIKLHGSIDWWEIRRHSGGHRATLARVSGYPFRLKDRSGRVWDTSDYRPRMLVGTTNKMLDYLKPFNLDRLAVFRRSLKRSKGLVIAGYSFRDKGVNELLIDWCWTRKHRVIVADPFLIGNTPASTARPAIKRTWNRLVKRGRLLPMAKRFDEAAWPEFRAYLEHLA
jgi:hypothetical protein